MSYVSSSDFCKCAIPIFCPKIDCKLWSWRFCFSGGCTNDFFFSRTYASMEELIVDYESGMLHPADVKPALSKALNRILQVTCVDLLRHFIIC